MTKNYSILCYVEKILFFFLIFTSIHDFLNQFMIFSNHFMTFYLQFMTLWINFLIFIQIKTITAQDFFNVFFGIFNLKLVCIEHFKQD